MSTAVLRVKRAMTLAHLDAPANLERITGAANEVWHAGDYVVRISSHPGTRRLEHEATSRGCSSGRCATRASSSYGRAEFGEWLVMRNIRGTVLARAWATMREGERRDAVYQLAGALREVAPDQGRREQRGARPAAVPRARQPRVSAPASARTPAARARPRRARCPTSTRACSIKPSGSPASTRRRSTDRHPRRSSTATCTSRTCSTRTARSPRCSTSSSLALRPPDLDLEIILRFCADPQLHVSVDYAPTVNRDDYRSVLRWIHEAYPALFENPSLESRLNLYSLSYDFATSSSTRPGSRSTSFRRSTRTGGCAACSTDAACCS